MRLLVALVVLALACSCVSASSAKSAARRNARMMMRSGEAIMARHELAASDIDYDSGGCTPLTVWENFDKPNSEWWDWEKRLPDLASKVSSLAGNARARAVFDAMKGSPDKRYFMYIDGRSQHKGENAFSAHYIQDMKAAHDTYADLIAGGLNRNNLNLKFYDMIHTMCFKQDAGELKKKNGFRGPNSWVYLPMPDRPLGVYHNIHKNGKIYFDPNLRKMNKNSEYKITGWKYNRRFQYRWQYPNLEIDYEEKIITGLFNKFWDMIEAIPASKPEGEKRNLKLNSIVWLFHSLENFHVFIDGNGRTNLLIMQGLLSWAGLHPISYYNSMESALTSVDEEREVVLEAMFKWETAFKTGKSGWTMEEINRKRHECDVATHNLLDPRKPGEKRPWQPDTYGGCMCVDPKTCSTNTKWDGDEWCYTNQDCYWKWDYCAAGRSRQAGVPESEWNPPQGPVVQNTKASSP